MADGDVSLKFKLFGQDVSATAAFKKVGAESDWLSSKMSGLGGKIGKMAAGAAVALGAMAVAGVATGVKTAAAMEQAEIAFGQLLGSGEKAKTFLADLSAFAAKTPFEFQGLVDSSRLLIGVGADTKQTMAILQDFGDTAGALGVQGEAFNRVILATSQAMSAGKFQAGDLNQIMTNGIPIWSILSKATGKSVAELRKMSEQGKLLASDVMPALLEQMKKDYGGAMGKQAQTLNGLWSTLKDTLSLGMAQALQPLMPLLKDTLTGAINGLAKALEWLSGSIKGAIDWFKTATSEGGMLNGTIDALKRNVDLMTKSFKDHRVAGDETIATLKILGAFCRDFLIPVINQVITYIGLNAVGKFRILSATIEALFPIITGLGQMFLLTAGAIIHAAAWAFGWVPGVGPQLRSAASHFDSFAASANAALASIRSRTVTVAFGAVFTPGSGDIFRKYGGVGTGVGVLSGKAGVTLGPAAPKVSAKQSFANFGGGGGGAGGGGGGGKSGGPTAAGKEFWGGIIASFKEAEPKIGAVIEKFADQVAKVKITEGTKKRLTGIVETIAGSLEKDTSKLKLVKQQVDEAKKTVDDLVKARDDYAKQLAQSASGGSLTSIDITKNADGTDAVSAKDKIQAFRQGLSDRLVALGNFSSNLNMLRGKGLDKAVLQQIADSGVETGAALAEALATATPSVINEINTMARSLSVQTDEFGKRWAADFKNAGIQAAQGLLIGIQSQQSLLEQAVTQLGQTLVKTIKKSLGIKSPSTVFRDQVGMMISAGIADGIIAGSVRVNNALDTVVPARPGVGAAGYVGAAGGGTVVYNLHPQGLVTGSAADVARYLEKVVQQAGRSGVKVNLVPA